MKGQTHFGRTAALALGALLWGFAPAAGAGQRPEAEQRQTQTRKQERNANAGRPQRKTTEASRRASQKENGRPDRGMDRPPNAAARAGETGASDGRQGNAGRDRRQEYGQGQRVTGDRPPWAEHLRGMAPEERQRVIENNKQYNALTPEAKENIQRRFQRWDNLPAREREELRERERVWRQMTPEQQEHVRRDVLPKWREMPTDRRQAIQKRLSVLREMPEAARNRRLNDPQFTRGMSAEDKAMLRDLSHLHVGGAPDAPGEPQH